MSQGVYHGLVSVTTPSWAKDVSLAMAAATKKNGGAYLCLILRLDPLIIRYLDPLACATGAKEAQGRNGRRMLRSPDPAFQNPRPPVVKMKSSSYTPPRSLCY